MSLLVLLEALAVGALVDGGVCLVGADLDAVQTAVSLVGAVMCALLNAAADGTVRGAGAAFLGMLSHGFVLLIVGFWRLPNVVCAGEVGFMLFY